MVRITAERPLLVARVPQFLNLPNSHSSNPSSPLPSLCSSQRNPSHNKHNLLNNPSNFRRNSNLPSYQFNHCSLSLTQAKTMLNSLLSNLSLSNQPLSLLFSPLLNNQLLSLSPNLSLSL